MKVKRSVYKFFATLLVIAGLAMVAYPLYLKVEAYLEQRALDRAFAQHPYVQPPPDLDLPDPGLHRPRPQQPDPEPPEKEPPAVEPPVYYDFPPTKIVIPALGVDVNVVAVDDLSIFAQRLNHPPGYYPQSAFPGQVGNVLIAGHRGGPAGYFLHLDRLQKGDEIILRTPGYNFHYEVERVFITVPTDWSVAEQTAYPALTLTTCQRVGTVSNAKRLIVRARFVTATMDQGD